MKYLLNQHENKTSEAIYMKKEKIYIDGWDENMVKYSMH